MLNTKAMPKIPIWRHTLWMCKIRAALRTVTRDKALLFGFIIAVYISICLIANANNSITNIEHQEEQKQIKQEETTQQNEAQKEEYLLKQWQGQMRAKYKNSLLSFPTRGVAHIKTTRKIQGKPIKINILEINPQVNKDLIIKPQTASPTTLNSKAQISKIAAREKAIAAVNGGYFKPQSGVSLGTLMIDNKMLTGPIYNRVGIGIEQNELGTFFEMGRVYLDIRIENSLVIFKADNINQPRMLSTHKIVYTPDWGQYSPPPPKYGVNAIIRNGQIISVSKSSVQIPKDGYVLSAPNEKVAQLIGFKNLKLNIKVPENFQNSNHIISGGPYLVKNGGIYIDMTEEKLGSVGGRNPRSAIGYDNSGRLIIVTVDGREESSVGMTLPQLAGLMKSLGCTNAMNFDGGGSSVMYVQGRITNSPPQKGGIAISNALTISERN